MWHGKIISANAETNRNGTWVYNADITTPGGKTTNRTDTIIFPKIFPKIQNTVYKSVFLWYTVSNHKKIDGGTDMEIKKFIVGDTLIMKKPHPCNKKAVRFSVLTVGSDIKVKCLFCDREVMIPRVKLEKSIKLIEHKE